MASENVELYMSKRDLGSKPINFYWLYQVSIFDCIRKVLSWHSIKLGGLLMTKISRFVWDMDCIHLAHGRVQGWALVNTDLNPEVE
jgi:hypothetical protein